MYNERKKKKVVVFSGSGLSAPSGIDTFRDDGGIWQQYDIASVATVSGWHKDPEKVLGFYNARRAELEKVEPNAAHQAIAELESKFEVVVITQNVDDLHERAGSTCILHVHGEITKARSTKDSNLIYNLG